MQTLFTPFSFQALKDENKQHSQNIPHLLSSEVSRLVPEHNFLDGNGSFSRATVQSGADCGDRLDTILCK